MTTTPYDLKLSASARNDLRDIRAYTLKTHGLAMMDSYDALIK